MTDKGNQSHTKGENAMSFLYQYFRSLFTEEEGQTFVEYALVLVLISLVLAAVTPGLDSALSTAYAKIAAQLSGS